MCRDESLGDGETVKTRVREARDVYSCRTNNTTYDRTEREMIVK